MRLLVVLKHLAHRARSLVARCAFATSNCWLSSNVVDEERQMHVEMDQFVGGWVTQLDWIAASWTVQVKFFHNRLEKAIVVLNTRRKHSMQANIRHEATQPTVEIEDFSCHGRK